MNRRKRKKKVEKLLRQVFGDKEPAFVWNNYPRMRIHYDFKDNSLYCDDCYFAKRNPNVKSLNTGTFKREIEYLKQDTIKLFQVWNKYELSDKETSENRMTSVIKGFMFVSSYGNTPNLLWQNHEPMEIVYDEVSNSLVCNNEVSIPFTLKEEELYTEYTWFVYETFALEVMRYYKEKYGIELIPLE